MFAPHTVTLYNAAKTPHTFVITLLEGVFLDAGLGKSTLGKKAQLLTTGLSIHEDAALFIPFDCKAVNALTGQPQQFIAPKIFNSLDDPSGAWTVGLRGQGTGCFFVKGSVIFPDSDFHALCQHCDDVFRVSSVLVRDFGSRCLHHWKVGGCAGP